MQKKCVYPGCFLAVLSVVLYWMTLDVGGDKSSGSPFGWLVGPDHCFQSQNYQCIRENPDPYCTYEVPWCNNVTETSANGKEKYTNKRRSNQMSSIDRGLNETVANRMRLKAHFKRKRRQYQQKKQLERLYTTASRLPINPNKRMKPRIIGGEETYPGAFPWVVRLALKKNDEIFCSGSLISKDTILTAAHCLYPVEDFVVILGDHHIERDDPDEQAIEPLFHCLHPSYDPEGWNDLAIVKLKRPVRFSKYIQPICTFSGNQTHLPNYRGNCLLVGWGLQQVLFDEQWDMIDSLPSDRLLAVGMDETRCPEEISTKYKHTVICLSPWKVYKAKSHACQGDSGGPLACYDPLGQLWYQRAVLRSSMSDCGRIDFPHRRHTIVFDLWTYRKEIEFMAQLKKNTCKE